MSDQPPYAPPAQAAPVAPDPKRNNPLGLTALIVGIVAVVGCAIPIVNFVSIFLGVVALILGIIGLVQKGRTRGTAIAGAILGIIALIVGISTAAVYASIANGVSRAIATSEPLSTTAPESSSSAAAGGTTTSGARTVHYEVTSDGKTIGNVTYLTVNDGKTGSAQAQNVPAPWSKDVEIQNSGLFTSSVFSLVAQADANASTITCKITADGKTIQESTSTGAYAVATCSGTAN